VRRKMTIAPARINREEHHFKGQFASQAEFQCVPEDGIGRAERAAQMIKRSLLIEPC